MSKNPAMQFARDNWAIIMTLVVAIGTAAVNDYRIKQLEGKKEWMLSQQKTINELTVRVAVLEDRTRRSS